MVTPPSARRGTRAVTVPGVVLVILLLILPVAQLLSGNAGAPQWEPVIFGMAAIAVYLVCFIPWLSARWARKLQRELSDVDRSAAVTIVAWWPGTDGEPQLNVLQADTFGLKLHDSAGVTAEASWRDVAGVEVVQHGLLARESIHVMSAPGVTQLRFVPMGCGGAGQLSPSRVREYADHLSGYSRQRTK